MIWIGWTVVKCLCAASTAGIYLSNIKNTYTEYQLSGLHFGLFIFFNYKCRGAVFFCLPVDLIYNLFGISS